MLKIGILPRIIEKNTQFMEFKTQTAVPKSILDICQEFMAVPVILSLSCGIDDIIGETDALVIPGSSRDMSDPLEFSFDCMCINRYMKAKKPVFGICAGMQEIWNCLGGRVEKIESEFPHMDSSHKIKPSGVFSDILPLEDGNHTYVNSFHNLNCVPSEGMKLYSDSSCFSPDGILEGIFLKEQGILGVQWHPEVMEPVHRDAVFGFFFKICRGVQA